MRQQQSISLLWSCLILSVSVANAFSTAARLRHTVGSSSRFYASSSTASATLVVGDRVGKGSYGVVHLCELGDEQVVCKRSYTLDELNAQKQGDAAQRLKRCQYYQNVEKHCFEKLQPHPQIPTYRGIHRDNEGNEWMTWNVIQNYNHANKKCCPTLQNVMDVDWKVQHEGETHHLDKVREALGLEENLENSFASTLDAVITSLLQVLAHVHSQAHIVHRDVKPGNLLVDSKSHSLILIDFGSAADMDPVKKGNGWFGKTVRVGLEDGNRCAVSPIYCAPELFIQPDRCPFDFDVFSAALIVCQLLFNYLDERTDAGFHQQLEDANWDLDIWLSRELASKVRPAGLEEALEYLAERPGLWRLLGDMLRGNPELRVSSQSALQRWKSLQISKATDGPFFDSVVALMEECEIAEMPPTVQRPLHFVATFRRHVPLGITLSEIDDECTDPKWVEATKDAQQGDVFVQSIVPDSQADKMGIVEVGDRLQGVGELPLAGKGFERVLQMLEQQPNGAKYVTLHFDRKRKPSRVVSSEATSSDGHAKVVEQGAWSTKGRRKAQEDTFVLHEIHEEQDILLAGIFDGHGGTAASHAASQMVPYLMSETLRRNGNEEPPDARLALEAAWETTCDTYRHGCLEQNCIAEYDPYEGTLGANTGSSDLVAGTTASLVAIQDGKMTVLNCGDSRSLLFEADGKVLFATRDHSPDAEIERLSSNPAYSTPKCSLSRWYLSVGDYQYAVARSLEGPFATSKGIVSDPDINSIPIRAEGILVTASDGLFEVMDNEEVGRDVAKFRAEGETAGDAAKRLCSLAVEKGTSDNVSVVVVYIS